MNTSWPLWIIGMYWLWSLLDKEQQRSVARWFWAIIVYGGIAGIVVSLILGKPIFTGAGVEYYGP